jgi:hypothetical protein
MFEARDLPMPVSDEDSPVRSTQERANDRPSSQIVGTRQASTSPERIGVFERRLPDSVRSLFLLLKVDASAPRSLDRDDAKTFPASETLSEGEGTETDGEDNKDSRFSAANSNRNPPSVTAKPHGESDDTDSGTNSEPSPPKLKSKIAPKRKASTDDDEPNHSGTRTNPKTAHTGGPGWQGPRKTAVRKKKF